VATLVSPTDITLDWRSGERGAAGRVVEFATEPDGRYTILEFVPPEQTRFTHPDLMPETPFYYRVRPYFGPVSPPVPVSLPAGDLGTEPRDDDAQWMAPRTIAQRRVAPRSIRDPRAAAAAAPTGPVARIMHANGILFTWVDRAADEDGYLLEVRPAGAADYRVAAVLDPNVNAFGLVTLPTEKRASYRVRAFYYGRSSNVAHQTTGKDQTAG
jgi:hypothetical protein